MSDRPYAAQARQMCPESDEHHDNVWFCLTCRGLETRLTPVTEFLADLLSEEEKRRRRHSQIATAAATRTPTGPTGLRFAIPSTYPSPPDHYPHSDPPVTKQSPVSRRCVVWRGSFCVE